MVTMATTAAHMAATSPRSIATLMYEPMPDGRNELIAVEYITSKGPASLEGQLFNFNGAPNRYGLGPFYELHVWAFEDNPVGTFADWNTLVNCKQASSAPDWADAEGVQAFSKATIIVKTHSFMATFHISQLPLNYAAEHQSLPPPGASARVFGWDLGGAGLLRRVHRRRLWRRSLPCSMKNGLARRFLSKHCLLSNPEV